MSQIPSWGDFFDDPEDFETLGRDEAFEILTGDIRDQGGVLSHHLDHRMLDEQGAPYHRTVDFRGMCSSNHVISQQNPVIAQCSFCTALLCTQPWCALRCSTCGRYCCTTHSAIYQDEPRTIRIACTLHRQPYVTRMLVKGAKKYPTFTIPAGVGAAGGLAVAMACGGPGILFAVLPAVGAAWVGKGVHGWFRDTFGS